MNLEHQYNFRFEFKLKSITYKWIGGTHLKKYKNNKFIGYHEIKATESEILEFSQQSKSDLINFLLRE